MTASHDEMMEAMKRHHSDMISVIDQNIGLHKETLRIQNEIIIQINRSIDTMNSITTTVNDMSTVVRKVKDDIDTSNRNMTKIQKVLQFVIIFVIGSVVSNPDLASKLFLFLN